MCSVSIPIPFGSCIKISNEQLNDPERKKIMDVFEKDEALKLKRWTELGYLLSTGILYHHDSDFDDEELQHFQFPKNIILQTCGNM